MYVFLRGLSVDLHVAILYRNHWLILSRISIASPPLKHHNAELPLRVGLVHFVDSLDIHESMKQHMSPASEVQAYGASSTAMRSKYTTEKPSISTQDNHTYNSKTLM